MSTANVIHPLVTGSRQAQWPTLSLLLLSMLFSALAGCASWKLPAEFDLTALRARGESETVQGIKLSAAVLSARDSKRMFGADINKTGVQPVWLEVENTTNQVLWLLRYGTDPDLFSPLEVAWSFHKSFAGETNARLDEHFDNLSFQPLIPSGTIQSGILFTNPHHKTRLLSIDILGQRQLFRFTLFLPVPDDLSDETTTMARMNRFIEATTINYQNIDEFRARLEQLPCCAKSADASEAGDPLNVILVGEAEDIFSALVRRGFRIDALDYDNTQQVFDRPPDLVARKAGQAGVLANWLRIWVAPFRYQDQSVLVVQSGRPTGWRYMVHETEDLVLNPNVDEVRNLLTQDMLYSSGLGKLAYVTGVGATAAGETRPSLGGSSYHTDGLRAVMFMVNRPLSLSDLEILDWYPALKLHEVEAVRKHE